MLAICIGSTFRYPTQNHRPAGASIALLRRTQRYRAFDLKDRIECWRWPQLKAEDGFPCIFIMVLRNIGNHIANQSSIARTLTIPRCLICRVPAKLDPEIWSCGHAVSLEATALYRLAQLAASIGGGE